MNILVRGAMIIGWRLLLCGSSAAMAAEAALQPICGECQFEKVATCGGFLEGPSVDPTGGLWVMDITGDRILKVSDAGECVIHGKAGGTPNGSKFAKDGRMYITGRRGLLVFDPTSAAVRVVVGSYQGQPITGANDLAIDADGGVYFTANGTSDWRKRDGRVYYLAPGASAVTLVSDQFGFPNGIVISRDARSILVSEFALKRVVSYPAVTATGGMNVAYVYADTQGGVGADGIALDAKGRLFTANMGSGAVQVFGADGIPLGFIRLPSDAGMLLSNMVFRDGYLYVTESQKGEVWRVKLAD